MSEIYYVPDEWNYVADMFSRFAHRRVINTPKVKPIRFGGWSGQSDLHRTCKKEGPQVPAGQGADSPRDGVAMGKTYTGDREKAGDSPMLCNHGSSLAAGAKPRGSDDPLPLETPGNELAEATAAISTAGPGVVIDHQKRTALMGTPTEAQVGSGEGCAVSRILDRGGPASGIPNDSTDLLSKGTPLDGDESTPQAAPSHIRERPDFLQEGSTRGGVETVLARAIIAREVGRRTHRIGDHWDQIIKDSRAIRSTRIRLRHGGEGTRLTWQQLEKLDRERVSVHNPFYSGEWQRIDSKELLAHQLDAMQRFGDDQAESYLMLDEGEGLYKERSTGKIWIPEELFERVLVHTHIATRHGSKKDHMEILNKYALAIPMRYRANSSAESNTKVIRSVVDELRRRCIHCRRVPQLVRRPLHVTYIAARRGEIIHADYLYVDASGYMLSLVDNLTRFTYLVYAKRPTAEIMARALIAWAANWGLVNGCSIVTDQGSHFANALLASLTQQLDLHNYSR